MPTRICSSCSETSGAKRTPEGRWITFAALT
jgi:hypothetical protein